MKILALLIIFCDGSPGDRSSWYRSCFAKCISENCDGVSELPAYSFPLTPLPCPLKCKANCIETTRQIIDQKWNKQVQFFGKWPFRRLGNCEELASCVFSVGNLVFTIAGYLKAKRMFSTTNDKVLLFHAFVCSFGWIMSAQFHARETKTSEKLDYFGALAIVYATLFLSLSRNFGRRSNQNRLWSEHEAVRVFGAPVARAVAARLPARAKRGAFQSQFNIDRVGSSSRT
jgi:hypothetical protein